MHTDKKELTACLYSLGEERTSKEIAEVMNKYGDGKGHITYNGFKEFMIHLLGDSDTKDEVVESLRLINKGKEHGEKGLMGLVMKEEDVAYIERTAPKKAEGLDYKVCLFPISLSFIHSRFLTRNTNHSNRHGWRTSSRVDEKPHRQEKSHNTQKQRQDEDEGTNEMK